MKLFGLFALFLSFFWVLAACDEEGVSAEEQREREDRIIREYLSKNNLTNFQQTESGMYYIVLEEGTGVTTPDTTLVTVDYEGWVLYGQKFDSSFERGEPIRFQSTTGRTFVEFDTLNRPVYANSGVIDGWVEAIDLMKKGEKTRFFMPSQLAYGAAGTRDEARNVIIPGNQVIYFDIKLLDF